MPTNSAMGAYHWYMLAQTAPLPETLLSSDPEFFVRYTLASWAAEGFIFDQENLDDYIECFHDPASIHATCEDYRAGWTRDREADEADQGKRKIDSPLLVIWGRDYSVANSKSIETWRRWPTSVTGQEVPGGHLQCEEAPAETLAALLNFVVGET